MWLFTPFGFVSVVAARLVENGKITRRLDPDTLMIRARSVAHLEALQERYPTLRAFDVRTNRATDYHARLIVPKPVWVGVAAQMMSEIDYGNFKSECSLHGKGGYVSALHSVWSIMFRMQKRLHPKTGYHGVGLSYLHDPDPFDDPEEGLDLEYEPEEEEASSLTAEVDAPHPLRVPDDAPADMDQACLLVFRRDSKDKDSAETPEAILLGVDTFKRGRDAVRAASDADCFDPISRKRLRIIRCPLCKVGSHTDAPHLLPVYDLSRLGKTPDPAQA